MSDQRQILIILCGRTEQIGQAVTASLKPEYEVIQFILTPQAGVVEIPTLLSGSTPPTNSSNIDSANYSKTPAAIVLGGRYDNDGIYMMRDAIDKMDRTSKVPWLRSDMSKPTPPLGAEYVKVMVARAKEVLGRLREEGKLDGVFANMVWY